MNPSPIPHHQSPIKTKHPSLNFNLNKVDHKSSRDRLPRRGKIKIMSTINKKEIAKMDRPSPSNFHLSTSISGKVGKNASKLQESSTKAEKNEENQSATALSTVMSGISTGNSLPRKLVNSKQSSSILHGESKELNKTTHNLCSPTANFHQNTTQWPTAKSLEFPSKNYQIKDLYFYGFSTVNSMHLSKSCNNGATNQSNK